MSIQLQVLILVAVVVVGFAIYGLSAGNKRKDESESNWSGTGGGNYPGDGD